MFFFSNKMINIFGIFKKDLSEEKDVCKTRQQWSNSAEFLLTCISMAVGLGNIWRFPFTAYENGGGAFLIPYIIVLFLIGKPLYYMELCMGQFSSYGPVKVWNMVPAFKGIGYAQVVAVSCVASYYLSIMGMTVYYFIASFQRILPWSTCLINASQCVDHTMSNFTLEMNQNESITAPEYYFTREVLNIDPNGLRDGISAPDCKLGLCLAFSWAVVFIIMARGVKSSGKTAYFTAIFPYIVLLMMLIKGSTLPGALNGIAYFIRPQWNRLLDCNVWFAAIRQSFFSLNVGFGSIVMFSSYNKFNHNVYRDATIVSVADTLTSILAGVTIFAILGNFAHQLGTNDIEHILKGGGTSLAFVTYPDVLSRFEHVPQVFSVLFFLMLFTIGIGGATSFVGCLATIICDEFPNLKRFHVTFIISVVGCCLGLFYVTPQGQYLVTIVDHYGGSFITYLLALFEVFAVHFIYGTKNFVRDIEFMLHRKTGWYWKICWAVVTPAFLTVIFVYSMANMKPLQYGDYTFGTGANGFGIFLVTIAMLPIPVEAFRQILSQKRKGKRWLKAVRDSFSPSEDWGPQDRIMRQDYRLLRNESNVEEMRTLSKELPADGVLIATSYDA